MFVLKLSGIPTKIFIPYFLIVIFNFQVAGGNTSSARQTLQFEDIDTSRFINRYRDIIDTLRLYKDRYRYIRYIQVYKQIYRYNRYIQVIHKWIQIDRQTNSSARQTLQFEDIDTSRFINRQIEIIDTFRLYIDRYRQSDGLYSLNIQIHPGLYTDS